MPEMDGVMLARAIKADPAIAAVPLIMMTSLGNHGDRDVLLDAGVAECLTKPVKKSQLRGCVERVLTLAEPPSEMAVAPAAPAPPIEPAVSRSRGRILVAEDNIVNQKVALLQLRKLGYTADAVANGAEAVEALARTPYDLRGRIDEGALRSGVRFAVMALVLPLLPEGPYGRWKSAVGVRAEQVAPPVHG